MQFLIARRLRASAAMSDSDGTERIRLEGDHLVVEGPVALSGSIRPEGDKSVSHRALLLAALAQGESRIANLGSGKDVASTARLLQSVGVSVQGFGSEEVVVIGSGGEGYLEPHRVIDCGNSATTMRLGSGFLAGIPYLCVLTGDASLRKRPMDRVAVPLSMMGAGVETSPGGVPPVMVRGGNLRAIDYDLPVPSAQVKGAILIAGLSARGRCVLRERYRSREHTETMLRALGADIQIDDGEVSLSASRLKSFSAAIPGDISSAAFFLIGACTIPGSSVRADKVVLSEARRKFAEVISVMGGDIAWDVEGECIGQPYGSVTAAHNGLLESVEIGAPEVPALIDEIVMLAFAACSARGTTKITGASELRTKESDRISHLACELRKTGASIEELPDGLVIEGIGGPPSPAEYDSHGDHRIAMAAAIAACAAGGRSVVSGIADAAVSYPNFVSDLIRLAGVERH
jgi:3-phosphoshikimate 1-carboxyvinyltransferase